MSVAAFHAIPCMEVEKASVNHSRKVMQHVQNFATCSNLQQIWDLCTVSQERGNFWCLEKSFVAGLLRFQGLQGLGKDDGGGIKISGF